MSASNHTKTDSTRPPKLSHTSFLQGFFGTLSSTFRDKGAVLMLIIGPLIYGFFYPWPYQNEVLENIPVGIIDHDHSELSQTLIRYSQTSPSLEVTTYHTKEDVIEALYHNDIAGYMVIPDDLEKDVLSNKPTYVSILGNNSYFLLNKYVLTGFTKAVSTVSAGIEIKRAVAQGAYAPTAEVSTQAVPLRIDPLFNRTEGYGAYVVPAVAILILQQTLLIGTALLIGTWYERKQQYATVTGWLGRIMALASITFFGACFYYGWVFSLQGYSRGHNMPGTLLFTVIFTITVATMGCLLGLFFRERERSMQLLIFIALPLFFLSGYPWPSSQLPQPLEYIRWLFPTTSAMNASVQLNQMGASLAQVSGFLYHLMALWAMMFILLLFTQYKRIKYVPFTLQSTSK